MLLSREKAKNVSGPFLVGADRIRDFTYEQNEPVGAPCRREPHATLFRPI